MSEYPDNWFRPGSGAAGDPPAPGSQDATAHIPGASPHGSARQQDAANWPSQPPVRNPARGRGSPGPAGQAAPPGRLGVPGIGGGRRWLRPRRIIAVLAVLMSVVLILAIGTYFFLDSKLTHKNVLVDYAGRPAASCGRTRARLGRN